LSIIAAGTLGLGGLGLHQVGLADPTPSVGASTAAAGTFAVDGIHSSVIFQVGYQNVANFYGRFNEISGSYAIDPSNPTAGSIDIQITTDSIDTANEGRDKHLRGADFFAAKEFPIIRFVGKEFQPVDSDTVRVSGELTLRGVTKPVTVDIDWIGVGPDFRGGTRSGFETSLVINRSEFGVNYGIDNNVLGDQTEITIAITGMEQ
jgi:polyisoprenoid-binding protein YceI